MRVQPEYSRCPGHHHESLSQACRDPCLHWAAMQRDELAVVAGWIREAARVLVFTGAGISTESGIPDFRGPNGVWKTRDPLRYTIQNYLADAEVRRESWQNRLSSPVDAALPDAGHHAVVALERSGRVSAV